MEEVKEIAMEEEEGMEEVKSKVDPWHKDKA